MCECVLSIFNAINYNLASLFVHCSSQAGLVIVDIYIKNKSRELRRQVKERIVRDYARSFSINVYGAEDRDPVWKTFYKK